MKMSNWKEALTEVKYKLQDVGKDVADFARENPLVSAATVYSASKVLSSMFKDHTAGKIESMRERDYYDPRTGTHAFTKRKLKRGEKLMIDERHRKGESYTKILYDMNLLK